MRIKVRENSKLWETTGTGNIWEKMKWPGHTRGQTKCKIYKGLSQLEMLAPQQGLASGSLV